MHRKGGRERARERREFESNFLASLLNITSVRYKYVADNSRGKVVVCTLKLGVTWLRKKTWLELNQRINKSCIYSFGLYGLILGSK